MTVGYTITTRPAEREEIVGGQGSECLGTLCRVSVQYDGTEVWTGFRGAVFGGYAKAEKKARQAGEVAAQKHAAKNALERTEVFVP